ncbi:hypothetical protein Pcinc_036473 [Petrolisthes cinctipes]|uniref:Uncharacterized protein n=1 Tax=Petrolisthes cinctipes TaxID=88211 RepID=A0AAE1EMI4_PETCI|nr:hypothetical protein Pcinc_036473 [Petrolisthes cinctipes]
MSQATSLLCVLLRQKVHVFLNSKIKCQQQLPDTPLSPAGQSHPQSSNPKRKVTVTARYHSSYSSSGPVLLSPPMMPSRPLSLKYFCPSITRENYPKFETCVT